MDDKISEYLNLLRDNIVVVRRYQRPDWFDGTYNLSDIELNKAKLLNQKEYHPATIDSKMFEDELLFPDSIKRYELNGYQKDSEFEEFLILHFEKFKNIFAQNNLWNNKDAKAEIVEDVRTVRYHLDHLLPTARLLNDSRFNSLIKVKTDICVETLRFINYPISNIEQFNSVNSRPIRKKKQIAKLTDLTQNQIVILFHYLRENGYIGKDTTNTLYAAHISELTGFAEEKIRQDLSHISNNFKSADSREFLDYEYSAVKRALNKVIASIEKYSEEHFPS